MKNFLKKFTKGNGIRPSEICLKSFNQNFENALNVEWFKRKSYFEAIFYKNNQEHIAVFSLNGKLLEYKRNMLSEYLPEPVKKIALSKGEIMNSVLKNKGNMFEYELIVRDKKLNRYMIVVSDMGELKDEKIL